MSRAHEPGQDNNETQRCQAEERRRNEPNHSDAASAAGTSKEGKEANERCGKSIGGTSERGAAEQRRGERRTQAPGKQALRAELKARSPTRGEGQKGEASQRKQGGAPGTEKTEETASCQEK